MKKFLANNKLFLSIVIASCFILFLPGFFTYFHQDDFIHLSFSQNLGQVISAFNIFQKGEFPFYRPIPTQVYFFITKTLFRLNPFGYHLVNFILFSVNIYLVNRFVRLISKNAIVSAVATIFFAINSTHFAPLYSAAYVHELFYVLFGVLTVDNFFRWMKNSERNNYIYSILFFILALMSKETAVVLPGIVFLVYAFNKRHRKLVRVIKVLFPFTAILVIYLFAHFYFYGIAQGSSYALLLGKPTFNILVWYLLWALSTPNILIDFIQPGLRVNPVFFQVSQASGTIYMIFFPVFLLLGFILIVKSISNAIKKRNWQVPKLILFGFLWFVVGMFPLIIFPLHKLATEQAFSLVGLSIVLGAMSVSHERSENKFRLIPIVFIALYLVLAINSIVLARKTHWIVRSALQAQNTIYYLKNNYPELSDNSTIYFKDGEVKIAPYGSSRQLYQATGNGYGIKLVLYKPKLNLYFEEINPLSQNNYYEDKVIEVDSSKLLGY